MSERPIELSDAYYLDNSSTSFRSQLERYEYLVEPDRSPSCIASAASRATRRRLYARLYLRVGPVFRRSRLRYEEIDLEAAISELEAEAFARHLEIVARARSSPRVFFRSSPSQSSQVPAARVRTSGEGTKGRADGGRGRTPEVLAALRATDTFIERPARKTSSVWRSCSSSATASNDLSEFVLVSLDRARYPDYEVARDLPLFSST
jgi:hypothetical protein